MQEKKGIISTVREKLNSSESNVDQTTDSIKQKLPSDTLKHLTDSLKRYKWKAQASRKYDSIQQVLTSQNRLTSVAGTVTNPIDNVVQGAENLQQKSEDNIQGTLDSVEHNLNKPLDNVNSKILSIEKPVEQKVEGLNKTIDQMAGKLQTDTKQGFDKATDGTVNGSGQNLNVRDINLPSTQRSMPGVDIFNTNTPGLKGELPGVSIPKESLKVLDAKLNVEQLKEKANVDIPEMNKLNIGKDKVDSKLAEAEKYQNELQSLNSLDSASIEAASKRAEEKIMDLDQMEGVKEQTQILTKQQAEYNAMIQKYKDKKLLQQEMTRKAKDIVNEKVNQYTPEVTEAMKTLNKSKKDLKEILSNKNNGMTGKPIGQRLIPGITIQSYNREVFLIDFGIQLGYRVTGRLRTGVGGIYRTGFDESYPVFVKGLDIYGGRTYAEFLIRKGIYLHAEYELLNVTYRLGQIPEEKRLVSAGYFGLGKQFNISRKLKGHTLALYRTEFSGSLPDQSKINFRLGFDLRTDKKRSKKLKIKDI